ncbi:MAG: hypothetical protein K6D96_02570 [Acetatifactor sp.]|nr:hypothetical protein [Acetatifactor sp.]
MYYDKLSDRKALLEDTLKKISKEIKDLPEGNLRIDARNGHPQYYHVAEGVSYPGSYIPKKDHALANSLAQKKYLSSLEKEITTELSLIDRFLDKIKPNAPENVYSKLNDSRKLMVSPFLLSDEEYIKKWESEPYIGKSFDEDAPYYATRKGEQVRSKSEVLIANLLLDYNIPYKYECPVYIRDHGLIYPDFKILHVKERREIYIEHNGMMDNPEYAKGFFWKQLHYIKNGYIPGTDVIMFFETKECPLDIRVVEGILATYRNN